MAMPVFCAVKQCGLVYSDASEKRFVFISLHVHAAIRTRRPALICSSFRELQLSLKYVSLHPGEGGGGGMLCSFLPVFIRLKPNMTHRIWFHTD